MKYYDGSQWVDVAVKTEDGGFRDVSGVKRWDGSQWIELLSQAIEDFERSSPLDVYGGHTSSFTETTTDVKNGSKAIQSDSTSAVVISRTDLTLETGTTYRAWVQPNPYSGPILFTQDEDSDPGGFLIWVDSNNDAIAIYEFTTAGDLALIGDTTAALSDGTWYDVTFGRQSDGTVFMRVTDDDGNLKEVTATSNHESSGGIGWRSYDGSGKFDYLREV